MRTILLATDLDKTLLGDRDGLSRLNQMLMRLRANHSLKLVYVTARSIESYNELIQNESLLVPDGLITSVGTEIYTDLTSQKLSGWPNPAGWDVDFANGQIAALPGVTKQPAAEQRDYKISYYLEAGFPAASQVRQLLGNNYEVIYSGVKYLDVLPLGVHKGSALRHLSAVWGIDNRNVIACGDSANDISMIDGNKAIIVGNAKQELLEWLGSSDQPESYRATGHYAEAIIEGLNHFGIG
ncbi:MAG: HAD-IIB family hydrolase [Candidatus Saccharibacteria bacterium]